MNQPCKDDFEWTTYKEFLLFQVMIDHRPIGVNKNFEMACIVEKLREKKLYVSAEKVWAHLATMYNLKLLDELEGPPFPNDEQEFDLPEIEFSKMKIKAEDKHIKSTTNKDDNVNTVEIPNTKDEKASAKDIVRRDSKDDQKTKLSVKKDAEKPKPTKRQISNNTKEEKKSQTAQKYRSKRPTKLSMKVKEPKTLLKRKSQSPRPGGSGNKRSK